MFKSKAQERWAFENKMPWAKKWADETHGSLPNKVRGGDIEKRLARLDAPKKKKKK